MLKCYYLVVIKKVNSVPSCAMDSGHPRRPRRSQELVIDGILSTQPELGPSLPDGGYGWVVFFATLFFQVSKVEA